MIEGQKMRYFTDSSAGESPFRELKMVFKKSDNAAALSERTMLQ